MENHPQSFDVCIICALPEEVRAFLAVVKPHCDNGLEEQTSPRYGYSYRSAALKNDKDELLTLHISWLPLYGPQEMTLHLSRILEECQARIAIMTGICAGDSQRVQLGDLVVAERTFTYDNGKFALDDDGRRVHLHDTMTYQLDANILQFLGVFDGWKPLVASLKRPPSSPTQSKRRKTACHIKPMASGSAVRADNPFEEVRVPVRGTVAIDMEGAAFGLVASRYPLIRWLIVKGICDYADHDKSDVYHDYAARASALYAFSFIRAYVTNERLPRLDRLLPSNRAEPSGVWNVPYLRNPYFTGRDELLEQLKQQLSPQAQDASKSMRRAALTQPRAIKGLGGIGKTQIAVEYAYRSREEDRYTHTFWVNSASEEAVIASLTEIAELLPAFPEKNESDQRKLVAAIKRWLEQCQQHWLLIFDNADDVALVRDCLPQRGNGSILLTTRANAVGSLATSLEVETMGWLEGTHLLLRRAQCFEQASDEEINQAGNIVVALDHFPLALDQAGAYLEETQCSFEDYLDLYQTHRKVLLTQRGMQSTNYPDSVATTWSLSFQKVEQANPAAAELLRLCAFLAPDKIPEELIRDGAAQWSPLLQQSAANLFTFNQMMAELLRFSLVQRLTETQTLSIHRLVQAVLIDTMELEVQRQWAERVIRAVDKVFPYPQDIATWPLCLRYLDQAQMCNTLMEHYTLQLIEAAKLLNRTGLYLDSRALYTVAEPLYMSALRIWEQQLGPEHPDEAYPLNNLAELYRAQGRYAEAEPLYQRALALYEQQLGATHPNTATCLNNLALLYYSQGKYVEAEPLFQRALSIREQVLGNTDREIANSLNNLAALYAAQEKYVEAEPLYRRALHIWEQQLVDTYPGIMTSLNNLAELYRAQGRYAEAEPLYQRALALYEQQLGAIHPDTASSLNNLAALYYAQGKYAQAEPLYLRVLHIWEQQLGPEHPNTAKSFNNLAALYYAQGKYAQAEPLYQRALALYEQQLGVTHPDTANSLNNLVLLYYTQGKYVQAELLFQHALAICEQQLGPEHLGIVAILNNLAALYQKQEKYTDSEPLYQRILSIREQQLGADHPDTAMSLNSLALLYKSQRRYAEAEPLYQRALSINEQQLEADHPNTTSNLYNLAALYYAQGKYAQAEPLYLRILHIWEQQLGPEHPDTVMVLNNLATLYAKEGKYVQAEPLFQRALAINEQQLGATHPDTATCLNNLAALYRAQGKYAEAEPLLSRALAIYEQQLGLQNPHT